MVGCTLDDKISKLALGQNLMAYMRGCQGTKPLIIIHQIVDQAWEINIAVEWLAFFYSYFVLVPCCCGLGVL